MRIYDLEQRMNDILEGYKDEINSTLPDGADSVNASDAREIAKRSYETLCSLKEELIKYLKNPS